MKRAALVAVACIAAGLCWLAIRWPTNRSLPSIVWVREFKEAGAVMAAPTVDGTRLYVTAVCDRGLTPGGAVHALDRRTGKTVWTFDDDGAMARSACPPRVVGERVYFGDGLHEAREAKYYCLEAGTGRKLWDFSAGGHVEGGALVSKDRIAFGAGDAGAYALDTDGRVLWHFAEPVHIDTSPAAIGDAVVVSSGVSRRSSLPGLFTFASATGAKLWEVRTDLPAWGGPVVTEGIVVCGLGHFRKAAGRPDNGAVLALDARDGRELWRLPMSAAVVSMPAADDRLVYAADVNGTVTAIELRTGHAVWTHSLNASVIAGLSLAGETLLVAERTGRVVGLRAADGHLDWEFDVAKRTQQPAVLTATPVAADDGTGRLILYLGCEIASGDRKAAVVYAVRLP